MASISGLLSNHSPQGSPAQSVHQADLSPETLISYLVASKRSLASINLVHRADTIIFEARASVESTSVLLARNIYLRRSLASQVKILRGVQFELEGAAQGIQVEVKALVRELDATDQKLEESIQSVKGTKVEEAFRRVGPDDGHDGFDAELEAKETLHDFVDDKPVGELRASVKVALDNVEVAKHEMDQSIQKLEDDLQAINGALADETVSFSSTGSELRRPDYRSLLKTLESHAREMAQGLESLVKHFDLCVTAIKHTEGGGDAVARKLDAEDMPEGMVAKDFEPPAQPMTEEERLEMMEVLENDAAEVDDAVIELQDRNAEMEAQLDQIIMWKERTESSYSDVTIAFNLLEKVGGRVSGHVAESSRYASRWAEEKAKIEDSMAGMEELCEVYNNFLNAYDGLIVEVARRKTVRKQMEKIAQEAQAKLARLYDEDLVDRDSFRNEQGDFLPSDIWHGLASLPPRFAVSRIDEENGSIPELPRKTVEEALKRLKARRTAA